MKSINTFISHLLLFSEWVREWCLKPLDQLFSHNMAKPIYCWWDDVVFFYSQAHGAWISFPPPPPPFFKIFIQIIPFSKCRKTVNTEYTYYSWCMTSTDIVKWRNTNDYENLEKGMIYMKILKKGGGVVEKRGEEETESMPHAPVLSYWKKLTIQVNCFTHLAC